MMTEREPLEHRGVVEWVEERAPFGLFTTDIRLAVTSWNLWLENHSGLTRHEVVGKNLVNLYPEIVDRKMDRYFKEALEGLNVVLSQVFHSYLLPIQTEDHADSVKNMPQSAIISPLIIEDKISGTVGYIEDVTERIRRENELMEQVQEGERLVEKLEIAMAQVKTLKGFLPICSNCKKIRDDKGYWSQVESYISKYADVSFSHGICPECAKKLYPEFYEDDGETMKPV